MNRAHIEESNYDETRGWTAKNKRWTICQLNQFKIQMKSKRIVVDSQHGERRR